MERTSGRVPGFGMVWSLVLLWQPNYLIAQTLPAPLGDDEQDVAMVESELPLPSQPPSPVRRNADGAPAFLGVTFEPQVRDAAVVNVVSPAGPAAKAGLQSGDVIESLNGRSVSTYQDVIDAIRWMKPGDSLDIEVSRRVRVRSQVVLEANESPIQHVTGYLPSAVDNAIRSPLEDEQLPAPLNYRTRPQQSGSRFQDNTDMLQPRRSGEASTNRNNDDNRDRRRVEQNPGSRGRGSFFRRRN